MIVVLLILLAALAYFAVNPSASNSVVSSVESIVQGKLSPDQIATVAQNAGFIGDDLITAVAVALAESGGDPAIQGDQTLAPTRGPSIGLWQINIGSQAHPEYANIDLTDPQTNANAAFAIYTHSGFQPWSSYSVNGSYQTFLSQASQGVADIA